ncbi:hypothetical protein [Novosphingobium sp.]|uniref:hypothetical protein n=1 Tax=Novosphingobium sp. TaxID=1874826 RepID=UPI002734DDBE|nr:hypothetical protein [Novosphingobium sp.]MDP3905935.1 hypothetical protein [Novosphingobium sp.]
MTRPDPNSAIPGEQRARLRQRRVWRAMLLPGLAAVAVLYAVRQGLGGSIYTAPGQIHPTFAIVFSVVVALFALIGAFWHHRAIDEQEERAILWGNTVGFYTAVTSAMIVQTLTMARVIEPVSHMTMMLLALAASVVTYLWHRFR